MPKHEGAPGSSEDPLLNEAQLRVVSVTMRRLAQALTEQARLLAETPDTLLTERQKDVDEDSVAKLASLSATAREELQKIAELCEIRPTRESTRRLIQSSLSVLWADLEDTRPQKLRGYGDVNPAVVVALGPRIDRLVQLIEAMQSVLDRV